MLSLCPDRDLLLRTGPETCLPFDPWRLTWRDAAVLPGAAAPIAPAAAMGWLFARSDARRVPVAVIGPKAATDRHRAVAEELGAAIGRLRLPLITGGRGGVMEAASRGCLAAGGQPIGILPDDEWQTANDFVAIPLATGLGPARNAVIARAAFALVAIGGEYGTLSEMAFGLHFGRLVVALENAPEVAGARRCDSVEEALDAVARRLFALDGSAGTPGTGA
ncbi:TIGR00725 family protein [Marinibaculum pumilum]|uniref:TIGR00725 family protein n=1 Tax=Marinibaculum pumilum TaxID=1766165 RepID=A0ABV7L3G9_9PROT